LISNLRRLDKSYAANNYQKLYSEIFSEFQALTEKLDYSISSVKLQLLKAHDTLKKNCSMLNEINEKKKKAIKKTIIREFIKDTKIPLCITSPSTMKVITNAQKSAKKPANIPDKIEITMRDEKGCIHERFAIIRELAASNI
jgi:hypothetical protein